MDKTNVDFGLIGISHKQLPVKNKHRRCIVRKKESSNYYKRIKKALHTN